MISNSLEKLQKNVSEKEKLEGRELLHTKPKDENHNKISTLFGWTLFWRNFFLYKIKS